MMKPVPATEESRPRGVLKERMERMQWTTKKVLTMMRRWRMISRKFDHPSANAVDARVASCFFYHAL